MIICLVYIRLLVAATNEVSVIWILWLEQLSERIITLVGKDLLFQVENTCIPKVVHVQWGALSHHHPNTRWLGLDWHKLSSSKEAVGKAKLVGK